MNTTIYDYLNQIGCNHYRINRFIYYIRTQQYAHAMLLNHEIIDGLSGITYGVGEIQKLTKEDYGYYIDVILETLKHILACQENKDYILLADYLEVGTLPQLQELVSKLQGFCSLEVVEDQLLSKSSYALEFTSSGYLTLKKDDGKAGYYCHSNVDPYMEAFLQAHSVLQVDQYHYVIFGLGLGYLIDALLMIHPCIQIDVYEPSKEVIHIAKTYSPCKEVFSSASVRVIHDKDFRLLYAKLSEKKKDFVFHIFYSSIRSVTNPIMREWLEDQFIEFDNAKMQEMMMKGNFQSNIVRYDGFVDELRPMFIGKTVFIIAAGPSLDTSFQELTKLGNDCIILCTGAALGKLLAHNITPDYIIISDGKPQTIYQIKDAKDLNVPIIVLATANRDIMKQYKGKKYIALQKGFEESEKIACQKGTMLINTGGSVVTTALDLAMQFDSKRIVFLGLDLSFPNNKLHHSESETYVNSKDSVQVDNVKGGKVGTSKNLNLYRKWMELHIEKTKIPIINTSNDGANVKGMKNMSMEEVLEKYNL